MEKDDAAMEIVEKGLVAPITATPPEEIWLSNLDHLVARAHTPTVYFYRRRPSAAAGFFSPEILKSALARALVSFYPLAGRLFPADDGRLRIRCTAQGAFFVVARSGSTVDDFGDFAPSDRIRRLLVPSVDAAADGDTPLVMLQLTFFRCGGVCLGAAVHHTATDGLGALHFINSWAAIARGEGGVLAAPFHDRTILCARFPPAITSNHAEYSQTLSSDAADHSPFNSFILKLSKQQLSSLRTSSANGAKPLSAFKAVAAHLWCCACKARELGPDSPTRLYMTADARTRLRPPLPSSYLGNAIFRVSAESKVGEVASRPLNFGAARIDAATARANDGFVRSLVDYLEEKVGDAGVRKGAWVMPTTDLWVISWQGLPIYEADFGWGKPVYMGRACLQFGGLVYVVPSPPEVGKEGGLLLVAAMEPENVGRFKEVFYEELRGISSSNL